MLGWVLLVLACAGALAGIPLLAFPWFEAGDTFAALHGDKRGVVLEPTAWEASAVYATLLVVLAVATVGAALAIMRGWFVGWTVGVGCAIAGGLVALILRAGPPDPGHDTYVTPGQAYDPTAIPVIAMGGFLLAAASLTVWALGARARRA